MIEEWKPVVGYEGIYEVSNIGNIRSIYDGRHKRNGIQFAVLDINLGNNF